MLRIHKGCRRQGYKASLAGKQTLRLTFDFALQPLGAKVDGGLCLPLCYWGPLEKGPAIPKSPDYSGDGQPPLSLEPE